MKHLELIGVTMVLSSTVTVGLPLFAMTFAVVWSLLFEFDRSTSTHCRVPNYLPTVSAAIGLTPQAYVWRACIGLHTTPRLVYLWMYKQWLKQCQLKDFSVLKRFHPVLNFITLVAHFVELSSLLGLSVVSSRENGDVHEFMFIAFMSGATVCMFADCLNKTTIELDAQGRRLARRKLLFFILNITSFALALYFYFRHNKYCEPGVYTWFAFFEYIVILSNIAFHYCQGIEMAEYRLVAINYDGMKIG